MTPEPIDLHHLGRERIIASYLLDTDDGPALFDCGPSTTIDALKAGLADRGLALTDVRHLLLSHIHLDHAGAAGVSRPRAPGAAGARLAGRRAAPRRPVPAGEERAPALRRHVRLALGRARAGAARRTSTSSADRVLGLDCFPTPGHASHHVCYLDPDGTLYAGDACGVRVLPGRFVMPPTPPPEVDVDAWEESLDEIERRAPERLALIHFGVADDVGRHLAELRLRPARLGRVGRGRRDRGGVRRVRARPARRLGRGRAESYDQAMPLWQSYRGLARWAEKRAARLSTEP